MRLLLPSVITALCWLTQKKKPSLHAHSIRAPDKRDKVTECRERAVVFHASDFVDWLGSGTANDLAAAVQRLRYVKTGLVLEWLALA